MKFIFKQSNMIILIIAIILTIIGYALMAKGDDTYSVVILIVSYVILFPASIIIGLTRKDKWKEEDKN